MILVTGHKGFIGKHLTAELDARKVKWLGYDINDGQDIRDTFKLNQIFKDNRIDTVIALAARAGVRTSAEFPQEYIETNVWGTQNLLFCAQKFAVKHFIQFSSSSVYGSQNPPNSEEQPLKPESLYGVTKAACEMLVRASGIPATIIRPFTVYGENGRADQVIYKWLDCIRAGQEVPYFGDGETKRGYTYVGDLVKGLLAILYKWQGVTGIHNAPWACEAFNLGGREVITLKQLLATFASEFPEMKFQRLALPKGDIAENWADTSKARQYLNFVPETSFEKKVRDIIKFYKEKHNL